MRVKQISKVLALLMIYLILSITFFSASVFATIFKAEGMGQDKAPGVIRATDTLAIRTESVMPCSVSADFTNNTFVQMNCGSGTPMSCAYTKQVTNVTGMLSFVVMESGSGNTNETAVYIDNTPPTIITLSTSSLGSKVKATYTIRDTANENYLDKCGGIRKVELLLNNQVVNTTNHTVGQCTVNSFLTGAIANYLGKVNTSIRVQDYVGLSANATGNEVFIDSTPPKIKTGAKVYYPGTTDEIKIISTNSTKERTADVMVTIDENALAQSGGVFGDLSRLDKTNTSAQSNIAATCTRAGWNETYECTFSGIKLMPSSASTPINIMATDQAGNTANQSMSLTFSVANSAGTVTRVGPETSRCTGSICYVKAGTNNITADISSSSSFNQSEVLIQGTKAECTKVSNWQCRADAVIQAGATFIEVTGTDDLGNALSGRGNITVDSNAPAKVGVLNATPDCPTSKESLRIVVNVSEAQSPSLKIRAITDSISTNNETIATCSKIGTTSNWQCILTISNLKAEGINTNLAVIVEDFAGNQLVENVPVKICVEVNEIPDLIEKIKTTGTLPRIDRKTVSKIVVKVPISLQIMLKEPSVEITQRSTVSCTGVPGLSGQAYMIDDTGLKPTLVIPLSCKAGSTCEEEWTEAGKILINCTQEFNIKHGNRIYTQRETESITAELEYYNQPLGSVDENYNKKINEIKTSLQKLDKQIKKYNGINGVLGTICNLAEAMAKINQVLQALRTFALGFCLVSSALGPIKMIGSAIWKIVDPIAMASMKLTEKIWPSGWALETRFLIKGTCAIYTCKFYDFNTLVDIAISLSAYYKQKAEMEKSIPQPGDEDFVGPVQPTPQPGDEDFVGPVQPTNSEGTTGGYKIETDKKGVIKISDKNAVVQLDPGYYKVNVDQNGVLKITMQKTGDTLTFDEFLNLITNYVSLNPFKDIPALSPADIQLASSSYRIQSAVDGFMGDDGSWIFNPYKSKHYDSLCMPAILFNDRKERQLLCKRLVCLDKMSEIGGPIEACEFEYNLDMCMYVDSARYKLEGGAGLGKIFAAVGRAFFSNILGTGATLVFTKLCEETQSVAVGDCVAPDAYKNTICGVIGSALSLREIIAFAKNKFNPSAGNAPTDPVKQSGGNDFCSGVDYSK